jgi:hypothetical protein
MTPLNYLANVCCTIDTVYNVSLVYGAHVGDAPHWYMRAALPRKAILLTRDLARSVPTDDIDLHAEFLEVARLLGEDLKRAAPEAFCDSEDIPTP